MKYWTDFLPNRTPRLKRLSQIKKAMDYNLEEAEINVENLKKATKILERQIISQALNNNTEEQIEQAIERGKQWNITPTPNILNPNTKIKKS